MTTRSHAHANSKADACCLAAGWCARCGREHQLPMEPARRHCLALMEQLRRYRCLDFDQNAACSDVIWATDSLFGPAGGKMFGILSARDSTGHEVILRAFSGQYNGRWQAPGWALPLLDQKLFFALNQSREPEIKKISAQLHDPDISASRRQALKTLRRQLSAKLMLDIHGLYQVRNFRGESQPLLRVFQGSGQPPAGTGDCCAPKLLCQAAALGLQAQSMAEFYWGRDNKAGNRLHGHFYPPCDERCRPILGFMLCGRQEPD